MEYWFWIVLGLVTLTLGAEILVWGASRLARRAGISPLVVGLTVVAYGTSAPEVAVSVKATLAGQSDIALGNVIGSNTFNVLFILGLSALIFPLTVSKQLVRLDVPVMIGVSLLAWLLAADGEVGRWEGAGLLIVAAAYTAFLICKGRKEGGNGSASLAGGEAPKEPSGGTFLSLFEVAVGLVLLVLGGRWFVAGAVDLARTLGISELMIGLTIIAAGTSLPEVATSVMATIRRERDIAVGNVVGSNIFNILAVLGGSAAIAGVSVPPAALRFDLPVMIALAVACLPIFFTGGRISRWEGGLFLAYYAAYIAFLSLADAKHHALAPFSAALLWFALPATALGIGLSLYYALRRA